ncbi:MAG: ATP-grasp domain-containing protein [Candidatus Andersenbacteria bacterium]
MKPRIVVMYGGDDAHSATSKSSGAWISQHIPKSEYDVTPVHITHDGLWSVPLGNLPKVGSVARAMDMLRDATPAQDPKKALDRLLNRNVDSIITTIRGRGGDDGAMHSLAELLHINIAGSNSHVSKIAHNKHHFNHAISDVAPTPYSEIIKKNTSAYDIGTTLRQFSPSSSPFFIKPVHGAGSHGIMHVKSQADLDQAIAYINASGEDMLVQEQKNGDELSITLYKNKNGKVASLPASIVTPRDASFFNYKTKQSGHDNLFYHNHEQHSPVINQAQEIARDVYESLGCDGIVTIDMIADNGAFDVLDLNTIPTFTPGTPIVHQLRHAGMHPEALLRTLLP